MGEGGEIHLPQERKLNKIIVSCLAGGKQTERVLREK